MPRRGEGEERETRGEGEVHYHHHNNKDERRLEPLNDSVILFVLFV